MARVSLEIVASRIGPYGFGPHLMAVLKGTGGVGVFSVARLRRVWRCRIADVGANDFGLTRGNLTKTGFVQRRMAKPACFS